MKIFSGFFSPGSLSFSLSLNFSPYIDSVNIFFIFCWVLGESRIPLKQVLGCVRVVALYINSHEQTLQFSNYVGSLFLRNLFFLDFSVFLDF